MTPPNLTGSALAAWHRSEADRIEAEERARRPALAPGQVWKARSDDGDSWSYWHILPVQGGLCAFDIHAACGWAGASGFDGHDSRFEYVGLARDVLRVVPPDPPEVPPLVVPEGYISISSLDAKEGDEYSENGVVWWTSGGGSCHPRIPAMYHWRRKVQPDPPAPQVAPEPTGAELVGQDCWVQDFEDGSEWFGPVSIKVYHDTDKRSYEARTGSKWDRAVIVRDGDVDGPREP